jgi:hypothetical protein
MRILRVALLTFATALWSWPSHSQTGSSHTRACAHPLQASADQSIENPIACAIWPLFATSLLK